MPQHTEDTEQQRPIEKTERQLTNNEKHIAQANNQAGNNGNSVTDSSDPTSQSIETLANLHIRMERKVGRHQRAIETLTAFLGRPRFLYFILLFVFLWIGVNIALWQEHWTIVDPPPFSWLQGIIGLSALLMTTIVLITQNRQSKMTDQRRQLAIQVNLLVEQKVTKLIALVEELRRDLPQVEDRHDPEAEAMQQTVDPHEVRKTLNQRLTDAAQEREE